MLKRALLLLSSVLTLLAADAGAQPPAKQPILILLYTRFYDHSHPEILAQRLFRTVRVLELERKEHPDSGISALFQFSGTTSQVFAERDPSSHEVQQIRDAARKGIIEIGYTGEDEPSYLFRPKPDMLDLDTAEKRWTGWEQATERFLTDYKDPITGKPIAGLAGGLQRTQEVFGDAVYISGLSRTMVSGDSSAIHAVAKLNRDAVLLGFPSKDDRKDIAGYPGSTQGLSRELSRDQDASPELFWENGRLRLSELTFRDMRVYSSDETPKALQEAFAKLDRSRVRVLRLEIGSYLRYLDKRSDGSPKYDPMEWLYYHPDEPTLPGQTKAFVGMGQVENAYRNEEAVLKWLFTEFLPANPGSRFVSLKELKAMTEQPAAALTRDEVRQAAANVLDRFKSLSRQTPDYVKAGGKDLSTAESFRVFVNALAELRRSGSIPQTVKVGPMYGPLYIPQEMGASQGTVSIGAVIDAAAGLAPTINDDAWKLIPNNAVPTSVKVGGLEVNGSQFLRLMAEACVDPTPSRTINLNATAMVSAFTYLYPKNTMMSEQGNTWTLKPARLRLENRRSAAGF